MLKIGSWLYLLSILPILTYLLLVPYWLRGLSHSTKFVAIIAYAISTAVLISATILFIVSYSTCVENCYTTTKDEIAIIGSTIVIALYLFFVYKACKSYKNKHSELDS